MQNISIITIFLLFTACSETEVGSDAYGNFEATTLMVSSEARGRLLFLKVEEGQEVEAGQLVALVDTTPLDLQRRLIDAKIGTLPQKLQNALAAIEVLERRKNNLIRERDRFGRLVEKKAATAKQLDDLNGEITVVDQQIEAIQTQTNIANRAILSEKEPLLAQRAIINDQIQRSYIYNPIKGTVLTKLSEPSEMTGIGNPLYRIAQLDTLTLRFYVSGSQLPELRLGKPVEVLVDENGTDFLHTEGVVSWIAKQAEFTPKTIQTKEDRVNLVYAVEASVPNPEGIFKIGMPAEINFSSKQP